MGGVALNGYHYLHIQLIFTTFFEKPHYASHKK